MARYDVANLTVVTARAKAVPLALLAMLGLLLIAVPAKAHAGPASPGPLAPPSVSWTTGWYTPDRADTITLYQPAAPGRYPAVIFIHGGAWGRSQPNAYEYGWARELAEDQQWVVAVIGYPTKVPNEEVVEPNAIADAIATVARRVDVDDRAIALWGESAGGQLGLVAAYRDAHQLHPLVSGVVSISGPTDMRAEYNSFAEIWLHAVTHFEGISPQAARDAGSDRYSVTSPVDIVSPEDPPTFQAISRLDPLVPANQVKVLTQRLIYDDVVHQSVWLRGDGHSSAIENQYPPGSSHTVQQLAVSFLQQVFAARRVSFS